MSITIIGSDPLGIPIEYGPPTVETKYHWSDEWKYAPELEVVSFAVHASSREISSAEILRRYGQTFFPGGIDTDFTARAAQNLRRVWVRLKIIGEQGPVMQFVGQTESPTRNLKGSATIAAGDQAWVASGGLRLLKKMDVTQARF